MIPLRLAMRNFLPYRAPDDLRFEGIHLACLTGANGAGKSSILDGITWALWGQARARRDEDLIHQGQDDMHVQLDFEQEGIVYRVIRRRARSKRSSTGSLDLLVRNPDGQFGTMNEPSMRHTQEKINALLRLDYETFVHSSFLQQGKADAFTTQTPARRKQILADILGLAQWEVYEDRVKETLKEIEKNLNYCDTRINEINTELARKSALQQERAAAQQVFEEARAAWIQAQQWMDELRDAKANFTNAKEKKTDLERRQRDHQRDFADVTAQLTRYQEQIAGYDAIIAIREEIEGGYARLQAARVTDQTLSQKLSNLLDLDRERAKLNNQLTAARSSLLSEAKSLRKNIADMERTITANPGEAMEAVQAEVDALRSLEVERDTLNELGNRLREDLAGFKTSLKTIEAEGVKLGNRVKTLEATEDPTCPLCGQELTPDHRLQMVAQLGEEVEAHRRAWAACKEQIKETEHQLIQYRNDFARIEVSLNQLPVLLETAGKYQAQMDAAAQAEQRLEEDRARLQTVEADLEADSFEPEVRDALVALDLETNTLGYDQSTHDQTRKTLDDYLRYEQLQTRLGIALESLPTLQEALANERLRQERLTAALADLQQQLDTLAIEIAGLEVQVEEYNRREQEVRIQHTRQNTAFERLVQVDQALSSLEAQAARKAELEERRAALRYDEALYKELRNAFGRNGIPAMMIESAIPELELTANDLLMRMTDGRMNLRLTTQKEKVTGGVAETLDIEIADELGTRAYEMYSGGEAFRINFALRIALSQMLARRAGAHLRTLFIDEGFGTQDETGRDKLVEAITAIQDEFDLILVITHIDELRDSFPVHVVVEKTGSGSRVVVR